ncbi:hypothetical protein CYMTET_7449 [Cymbomonas tetramitiformis]|uniref:Uncharacterized protein n=1 Tax=Cymbomonas tetramitiformis TaxID=36881 RepID=A0AAE0GVG9_9CHLO|nr:hypothetical protein CYMTET_7449 [Cymbomonas tetramitiformis]
MPPSWTEGVGIAAGITDVPWSDEKDTGYNTAVDWGAAMLAISTVYKNMPGFVLLDGVRQTDVRGNTPSASRHLCTTLARSLNKPKLNYRKAVLVKFDKHGPELENVAQVQRGGEDTGGGTEERRAWGVSGGEVHFLREPGGDGLFYGLG